MKVYVKPWEFNICIAGGTRHGYAIKKRNANYLNVVRDTDEAQETMKTMVKDVHDVEEHKGGLYYSTSVANLRNGEFFVTSERSIDKDGEVNSESAVWIRGSYERMGQKYSCTKFADINAEHFFKGERIVYFGFTF